MEGDCRRDDRRRDTRWKDVHYDGRLELLQRQPLRRIISHGGQLLWMMINVGMSSVKTTAVRDDHDCHGRQQLRRTILRGRPLLERLLRRHLLQGMTAIIVEDDHRGRQPVTEDNHDRHKDVSHWGQPPWGRTIMETSMAPKEDNRRKGHPSRGQP